MKLLLLGASAGSVDLLENLFAVIPQNITVICAVHMRASYIYDFVQLLRRSCNKDVSLLQEFSALKDAIYVCDTTYNTIDFYQGNRQAYIRYNRDGNSIYRPDIDSLFKSVAQSGFDLRRCCAMLLSGIGSNGAQGLAELKQKGAFTMVLDEGSAPIYGIPKAAIEEGGCHRVVDMDEAVTLIQRFVDGELSWEN